MSFTTRLLVKRRLRVPAATTTHDLLIDDIVAEINDEVASATGQAGLTGINVDQTVPIWDRGIRSIGLDNFPIASVAALTISGTLQVLGTDYTVDLPIGFIHLRKAVEFPIGVDLTEVSYTTEDASASAKSLQRAATNWAVAEFNKAPSHGHKSERWRGRSHVLDPNDMPAAVQTAINRYIKLFQTI